jgi:hypothetical protein
VPTISYFYGILVEMFWREHPPPHYHVTYQSYRASIEIETGEVVGRLPAGVRRDILAWNERHKEELLANWERARQQRTLWPIKGADEDE